MFACNFQRVELRVAFNEVRGLRYDDGVFLKEIARGIQPGRLQRA
jgi:hypothetical protein